MSEQSLCDVAETVESGKPKNRFDKVLIGVLSFVLTANSLLLTLIIVGAATTRYVLKINFYGYDEIAVLIAFWLYFIGAAYGSYNNTHVSADVVDAYMPEGTLKKVFAVLRHLITASVCGIFAYYGYSFFMFGFAGPLGNYTFQPKSMVWRIPLWTSYSAISVGLIFMEIYFIRNLILSIKALFSNRKEEAV